MVKDQRIKNYHDLVKDLDSERYTILFSINQFEKIDEVITWLKNELNKKFTSKETDPKILFEKATNGYTIFDLLIEGDIFYCSIFESEKLIPENCENLQKTNPLTIVVNQLYNTIWDINNSSEFLSLKIYFELKKHIEQLLGKSTASDTRYQTFSDWLKIYHITHGMCDFYVSWVSNIDKKLIANNIDELLFIDPSDDLHELAEIIGHLNERENVSKNYKNKLTKHANKSNWEFIKEATDGSSLLSFNDDLSLKENLLLRFDIKSWLLWIDNLRLPILQDHAFFSIQDLSTIEQIIALILEKEIKFKTASQYLLLIALKNYYELLKKTTLNLFDLKEGQWHYDDNIVKQKIIDESTILFDSWVTSELEASCIRVFQLIFKDKPISESEYLNEIFEWINTYSKQRYIDNKYSEPSLKTLKTINDAFEDLLIQDSSIKIRFTKEITVAKINWQIFEKLIALFHSDETDSVFGDFLYDKYVQYIESENFNWNTQISYNDIIINQACDLSYLMTKLPDTMERWNSLFYQFKCWSEGWLSANNYDYKVRRKETYILMVGACLSYSYYHQEKKKVAKKVFDEILEIVLGQYRVASTHNLDNYEIIIKFLSHTLSKFSPIDADSFTRLIDEKCDDLELFLIVAYEITFFIQKGTLKLNDISIRIIKNQIDKNFWKIECRYSDGALKPKFNYFLNLKNEVLKNIL